MGVVPPFELHGPTRGGQLVEGEREREGWQKEEAELGPPAFFWFEAVTTHRGRKKGGSSAEWAGVGSACSLQGHTRLSSWWGADNQSYLFYSSFFFPSLFFHPPFLPLFLCTEEAHVSIIDMMGFVHLRTFLLLVVPVAQVLCQNSGEYIPVPLFYCVFLLWMLASPYHVMAVCDNALLCGARTWLGCCLLASPFLFHWSGCTEDIVNRYLEGWGVEN